MPHPPPATIIYAATFTVSAAGDVSDYDATWQNEYAQKVATQLSLSARQVVVAVTAASVRIKTDVLYVSAAEAQSGTTALQTANPGMTAASLSAFLSTSSRAVTVSNVDVAPQSASYPDTDPTFSTYLAATLDCDCYTCAGGCTCASSCTGCATSMGNYDNWRSSATSCQALPISPASPPLPPGAFAASGGSSLSGASSGASMSVIVGAAGGGGALLLLVGVGLVFCRSRRKKKASFASIMPAPADAKPMRTPVVSFSSNGGSLSLSHNASSSAQARMSKAQELLRSFEVDAAEITTLEKIGEGGQAHVVRGWWNGIEVAIKQPRPPREVRGKKDSDFASQSAMDSFSQAVRREVRALSRVRHPNVIKLHGACFDPSPMVLMDFATSGTLQDALDENKFQSPSEAVRLLAGVARGMEAVHAHKIIHLDLKPENVLIGPLDVPWITDFGLSTSANMTSMSTSSAGGRGTLPFKAPELFAHPPHVGPEADVYAYSILAWVVVCGEQPYEGMQAAATSLPQAVMQGVRPTLADEQEDWRDKTTAPLVRLIESCWHGEYAQRPAFGNESDGGEGKGIVSMLEKIEYSLSKGSEAEASQLSMTLRLISSEAEAEVLDQALGQVSVAQGDASTTAAEQKDLAEERVAMETSHGVVRQNAFTVKSQMPGGTDGELASTVSAMLQQQSNMFLQAMRDLEEGYAGKLLSMERSLSRLAEGELDCPRLFVLLPLEASGSRLLQLVKRDFVKDKYRLVFLDPLTGCAARCGVDGCGYKLEVPKKWLVENRKIIAAGLKIVKICAAAGRLSGLPLPSAAGLPTQAVSKAEIEALKTFEAVYDGEPDLAEAAPSGGGRATKPKAATGQAYKQLRKLLKEQCKDEYLVHCDMTKEKALDGSIEFVTAQTKDRFVHFGQACLIWNDEALKQKAVQKAAALVAPGPSSGASPANDNVGAPTSFGATEAIEEECDEVEVFQEV